MFTVEKIDIVDLTFGKETIREQRQMADPQEK